MARCNTESSTGKEIEIESNHLIKQIVDEKNMFEALKRVKQNRGNPGIDGMTVNELESYVEIHWKEIKQDLLQGTYKPKPVKRVYISKPGKLEKRGLGIPCVLDRFVQQMILQILQKYIDPTFSDHSYGFRPNRSAHQAISKAKEYINAGYTWVVDIDLEKFFDRVNHDRLMGLLAKRIRDKVLLKIIRAFLNAGVMEEGLVSPTTEGTPQGGPLSPLLSNIVLDELDRELERRGHKFVRYADDCNIYVRSKRAGDRVLESITRYIHKRLKLRVNKEKTAVDKVNKRKFLGFSFTSGEDHKIRISPDSIRKFKENVRKLTKRKCGKDIKSVINELSVYLRGWEAYYKHCETPSILEQLDGWIRHRLRSYIWNQWKTMKNRFRELKKLGIVGNKLNVAASNKGPWRTSMTKPIQIALPNKYFDALGLYRLNSQLSGSSV
jgi:RNA-directed DNA polymerase